MEISHKNSIFAIPLNVLKKLLDNSLHRLIVTLNLIARVRTVERTNDGLQAIAIGSPVSISKLEHLYPEK